MLRGMRLLLVCVVVSLICALMTACPTGAVLGSGIESGHNGYANTNENINGNANISGTDTTGSVDASGPPESTGNPDNGGPNTNDQHLNDYDYNYEHDYNYNYNYDCDRGPEACLYNGAPLTFDQDPIILENRTLVELRGLFEAFGGRLNWDEALQQANGSLNGNVIQIRINSRIALVNEQPVEMDVPALVMNGRTMVPLRFIAENFGKTVRWDQASATVNIDDVAEEPSV